MVVAPASEVPLHRVTGTRLLLVALVLAVVGLGIDSRTLLASALITAAVGLFARR